MSATDTSEIDGRGAAEKLNQGLPLENRELSALSALFTRGEGSYFAHLKFGIETGRIRPEEIVKNVRKKTAESFQFMYLMGYLLRNGLDPNYYFEGPYRIRVHMAVFLNTIMGGGSDGYRKYLMDLLMEAGSNFQLPAYTGAREDKNQTVEQVIGIGNRIPDSEEIDTEKYNAIPYKLQWKGIKNIILDRVMSEDPTGFVTRESRPDLGLAICFFAISGSSAVNILQNCRNRCLFLNSYGGLRIGVYMAINSQNYEFFKTVIDKGCDCNYFEMCELIARHNMAGEDKILKDEYSRMILYAIKTGSPIDKYQLGALSLNASAALIDDIRESYRIPEWKKLCRKGTVREINPINKRLRQIALELNIDFSLPPGLICDKLEKISNMDRVEFMEQFVKRQEERMTKTLAEAGDLVDQEELERIRCDPKTLLVNNPYSYNDARMAFYKAEGGELWCFTSDMFESLITTKKNPYTKAALPDMFVETIKTQLNLLELLDVKKERDNVSVKETLKRVFDDEPEISNSKSLDIYNRAVNQASVLANKSESDFRSGSTSTRIKKFLEIGLKYFSDCNYTIRPYEFVPTGVKIEDTEIPKSVIYKVFDEAKYKSYFGKTTFGEFAMIILAHHTVDMSKRLAESVIKEQGTSKNFSDYSKNYSNINDLVKQQLFPLK
jgi:hypothetical protein